MVDDVLRTKLKEDDADALMGVLSISNVCEEDDSSLVDTLRSCCDAEGAARGILLMLLLLLWGATGEVKVGERGLSMVLVHATSGLGLGGMLLDAVRAVRVFARGVRRGGTTPCWPCPVLTTVREEVLASMPSTMVRVTLEGEGPLRGGVVADLSLDRGT